MADFSVSLSFSTSDDCSTFTATDTSNYGSNVQGVNTYNIVGKVWEFRDAFGNLLKREQTNNLVTSVSVSLSLLSGIQIAAALTLFIVDSPMAGSYTVQNVQFLPCLLS